MTKSCFGPGLRNLAMLTALTIAGCSSYHYDPLADPRVRQAVNSQCNLPKEPGGYTVQQLGAMSDCTSQVEEAVDRQERQEKQARIDREAALRAPEKAREIWQQIQQDQTHSNPFRTDLYLFSDNDEKHALILAVADELRKTYGVKIGFPGGFLAVVLPTSRQP